MNTSRLIFASAVAAAVAIVFSVLLTIWGELAAPLKDWLKTLTGHHWTSKSVLSVLLYAAATAVLYAAVPYRPGEGRTGKALTFLVWCTVLGTVALAAFFSGHYLGLY